VRCGLRGPQLTRLALAAHSAGDAGAPSGETRLDGGAVASSPDASVGAVADAAVDRAALDAPFDVPVLLANPPCSNPPGLQAGAPWPIALRCPARAGSTAALGPTASKIVWQTRAPTDGWAPEVVVAADGTLYSSDPGSGVGALGPDGSLRWMTAIPAPDADASTVAEVPVRISLTIGVDGTVYAWNGDLTALHPDGSVAWTLPVTSYPNPAPDSPVTFKLTVGPDGTLYVVEAPPGLAGNLIAIAPSGETRWKTSLGDGVIPYASPSIGAGGTIYVIVVDPSNARWLVAYTPSGELLWKAAAGIAAWSRPDDTPVTSLDVPPAIADDGTVYAPCGSVGLSTASAFCAFTPEGAPFAMFNTYNQFSSLTISPPDGHLYAHCGTSLEAFTTDAGLLWSDSAVDQDHPPLVDGRGTLFLFLGGLTTAISPGEQVTWTGNGGVPVAVGADGTVYGVDLLGVQGGIFGEMTAFSP
jgi:hypothetical protein